MIKIYYDVLLAIYAICDSIKQGGLQLLFNKYNNYYNKTLLLFKMI